MLRTYRVGVIGRTGRGNYGHGIDTAWRGIPGVELVAVADDNKGALPGVAARLQVSQAFVDYREMLDKARPDIVGIGPRWVDAHREMAVAAAERGIHVYMEKPFCRTPAEADEIVAACSDHGVKLAVAHPTRYSPKLKTISRMIADGKIGTVLEFRGRGKEDRRGGGEDLWVLGTHILDMIRALGSPASWCSATVRQDGRPVGRNDVVDGNEGIGPLTGDAIEAMYGLSDGVRAYFSSHRNAAGNPSRYGLQIFGSAGVIELVEGTLPPVKFLPDPSWSPGRSGATWHDVSSAGVDEPEPLSDRKYRDRHHLAIVDLIEAIEQDRPAKCSAEEGRAVVEMIAAVFESHRLGRPVELPLATRVNPLTLLSSPRKTGG